MASALAATPALRPLGSNAPAGATLQLPASYVRLAPLCDLLDALSLLSLRQHVALLATILVGYAAWRWRRAGTTTRRRELRAAGMLLALVSGTYAGGMIVPRPMAALRLDDVNALAVDFHSHTTASHDGRPGFTVARNRAWHRAAGFDVAYVSDHATLAAVGEAGRGNAPRAGAGTTLLPAVEVWCEGQHVVVLGPTPRDTAAECTPTLLAAAADRSRATGPVVLLAITKRLWTLPTLPAAQGVEVSDAAPRAFDQVVRNRVRLDGMVTRLGLAPIAGSNNHGWGATAAAWTVLRIPGWRALAPEALDSAIRGQLRRRDTPDAAAMRIVERKRVTPPRSVAALALTAPAVCWTILTTMSVAERASWLAWTAIAWFVVLARERAKAARRSDPVPARVTRTAA